jgi:hypothetical protein
MNTLLLAVLAMTLTSGAFAAEKPFILYSEAEEGLFIMRDADLADAIRESDRLCAEYEKAQDEADRVARLAASQPTKRTLQREKAGKTDIAHKAMGACLDSDERAKKRISALFGKKALDRLQKLAPFEDMIYVQLLPSSAEHFEAVK